MAGLALLTLFNAHKIFLQLGYYLFVRPAKVTTSFGEQIFSDFLSFFLNIH